VVDRLFHVGQEGAVAVGLGASHVAGLVLFAATTALFVRSARRRA